MIIKSQSMVAAALKEERTIRWTAILIGILLIPLNSWWIMQMEAVYYSAHSTVFSLFFNTIFNLFLLTLISQLFRKLAPYLGFRQSEC